MKQVTESALTFDELRKANTVRCEASFHDVNSWSPTDWATAMGGECGEALNFTKKLRRMEEKDTPFAKRRFAAHSMSDRACSACGDMDGCHLPAKVRTEKEDCIKEIGKELADIITYADLFAARLGIDLGQIVRDKFNEVSDRVGSEIKL